EVGRVEDLAPIVEDEYARVAARQRTADRVAIDVDGVARPVSDLYHRLHMSQVGLSGPYRELQKHATSRGLSLLGKQRARRATLTRAGRRASRKERAEKGNSGSETAQHCSMDGTGTGTECHTSPTPTSSAASTPTETPTFVLPDT